MSSSVPCDSTISAYLEQVSPILPLYWDTFHKITNQKLIVHQSEAMSVVLKNLHFGEDLRLRVVFDPPLPKIDEPKLSKSQNHSSKPSDLQMITQLEILYIFIEKFRDLVLLSINEIPKEKEDFIEEIMKQKQLENKVSMILCNIHKVLEYFHVDSLGFTHQLALPSPDELKKQIEEISLLTMNEQESDFLVFNYSFETSDTNILCDILGIEESFAYWFDNEINTDLKMHESFYYYLINNLREKEEDLPYKFDVYKSFRAFGFTEERAKVIADSIAPDIANSQLPSYWADRYLEIAFCYHPLINDVSRYPYCPQKLEEWFEMPCTNEKHAWSENKLDLSKIKLINMKQSSSLNLVKTFLRESVQDEDDKVLLYHGTTHKSAIPIITSGIQIAFGNNGQDFYSGDGFFLSEKLENARKWSQGGRGNQFQAVVVYKVPKSLLDVDAEGGLDVCNDKSKWEEIICLCRSVYSNLNTKEQLLDKISFIRGPICKNPLDVVKGWRAEDFGLDDIQICIRNKYYARRFGSLGNVLCAVFF